MRGIEEADIFWLLFPSNGLRSTCFDEFGFAMGPFAVADLSGLDIAWRMRRARAANRDPLQFELPDQLDLARQNNRHLAFGFGIHQCAGLSLARLEGRIAIGRFLQLGHRRQLVLGCDGRHQRQRQRLLPSTVPTQPKRLPKLLTRRLW